MKNTIAVLSAALLVTSTVNAGGYLRGRSLGYAYSSGVVYPQSTVYAIPAPVLYYAPPVMPLAAAPCNCAGVANALAAAPAPTAVTQQETIVVPQPAPPVAVTYQQQATYTEPAPSCAPPPQGLVRSATISNYLSAPSAVVARGVNYSYGGAAFEFRRGFSFNRFARDVGRSYLAASRAVFAPVLPAPAVKTVVVAPRLARARVLAAPVVVAPPVDVNVTAVRRGLFGRVRSVTNVNVSR